MVRFVLCVVCCVLFTSCGLLCLAVSFVVRCSLFVACCCLLFVDS